MRSFHHPFVYQVLSYRKVVWDVRYKECSLDCFNIGLILKAHTCLQQKCIIVFTPMWQKSQLHATLLREFYKNVRQSLCLQSSFMKAKGKKWDVFCMLHTNAEIFFFFLLVLFKLLCNRILLRCLQATCPVIWSQLFNKGENTEQQVINHIHAENTHIWGS